MNCGTSSGISRVARASTPRFIGRRWPSTDPRGAGGECEGGVLGAAVVALGSQEVGFRM